MQSIPLSTKQMDDLHQRLRELPDCHKPLGLRHPFATVLTLSLAAVRAGTGLHRHRPRSSSLSTRGVARPR